MSEIIENRPNPIIFKAIGIGNVGCSAINYMIEQGMQSVEYAAIDTEAQTLNNNLASTKLKIDITTPEHLVSHSKQVVGNANIETLAENVKSFLGKPDMIFIIAEVGGKFETEKSLIIANIAREMNILTMAIVAKQFAHEKDSIRYTNEGIMTLQNTVDSVIVIPQSKAIGVFSNKESMHASFIAANEFMCNAVSSIVELMYGDSMIGIDFADLRVLFSKSGMAILGTGTASGENRSRIAAEQAISCLIAENMDMSCPHSVLVNITCDESFTMSEYKEVMKHVRSTLSNDDTLVIVGTNINESMGGKFRITIFAIGFNK